jgi:AcrR family transcriptional regulator
VTSAPPPSRLGPLPTTAAQKRIVAAAQMLFSEHGISGTSLQMIADALGVTKAAVYHQFNTKDEIVLNAWATSFVALEQALDASEAEPNRDDAVDLLLTRYIEIAVRRRRYEPALQNDPVMLRIVAEHEPFRQLMDRFYRTLLPDESDAARVRVAMVFSGINGAVVHPLVAGIDTDELQAEVLRLARELVREPATSD